jgi:RNA-directed DNA polymerase
MEQRGHTIQLNDQVNQKWEEPVSGAKPFQIPKTVVWRAYKRVKAKAGAAGVDSQSIEGFEENLKDNLYRIWNRMSSGTYFPPPVRQVVIPKHGGGERRLGIPTVADRIAQTVVKIVLEPKVEPSFHPDSYGYRPRKSAIQAVGKTRQRCWQYDWVLDLDVRAFFDTLDHKLVMHAVRKYTSCRWVLLYIERWLKAPVQQEDGSLVARTTGTPQGGVISPLLANVFLHLAFDTWMQHTHPDVPFERYADDIVVHCRSEAHAEFIQQEVEKRLKRCKLDLHPDKTKIAYCKDSKRRGSYAQESFDFLGFTFRPRRVCDRHGRYFVSFSPAVSRKAAKAMRQTTRSWRLHRRSDKDLLDLARMFNPVVRGWISYFGNYRKSALYPVLKHLNRTLVRWAMRKYKRLRGHRTRASKWLANVARREPSLFVHWRLLGVVTTDGW